MSKAVRFGLLLTLIIVGATLALAQVAPPEIFFTDLSSAPNSGGETVNGFSGAYVTLYGNGFGSTQGSSTVTWNGQNCLRVVSWGSTWLWYQKIAVQLGSNCTPGAGNFVVTVNGQGSTSSSQTINGYTYQGSSFAVRSSGKIYCVATSGSDSNPGTFSGGCWRTILKAKNTIASGDVAYVRNGVNQNAMDPSSSSFSQPASLSISSGANCNGAVPCATPPFALGSYPGETASVTACSGCGYIFRVPNVGGNFDNWTIFGMTFRGPGIDIGGASPATSWRMVGNDISCDAGAPVYGCVTTPFSSNYWWFGNNWHDVGAKCDTNGLGCKLYHTFYSDTSHVDFGWNLVDPDPGNIGSAGCRAVQWHDTLNNADDTDLHIHDNVIRNAVCDGINLSTINPDAGPIEIYNNLVYHVGKGPDPSGNSSVYTCIYMGGENHGTYSSNVEIYNNSFFDCGSRKGGSWGALSSVNTHARLRNNIIRQFSGENWFASNDSGCGIWSGSNNIWFGNGAPPCSSQVSASLNLDPLFVGAAAGAAVNDLHLLAGSPAVGAGISIGSLNHDIQGDSRPLGAAFDVGAYQLTSATGIARPNPPTNLHVSVQ